MLNTWHRRRHLRPRFQPRLDVLESRLTPSIFIVNTTADTDDGVADAANTTLREAINAANSHTGRDEIRFNIPGSGVQTINVGSSGLGDLPSITDLVLIDGYHQAGAKVNTSATGFNGKLCIELNGAAVGNSLGGLRLAARDITVQGLVINRFTGNVDVTAGIIVSSRDCRIRGNLIGTDATGVSALPNGGAGIRVFQSVGLGGGNIIGGDTPADRNLISGNQSEGIDVASEAIIRNNLIGTTALGDAPLPNGASGMFVYGTENQISSNVIGANGAGAGFTYHHGITLTQLSGPAGYNLVYDNLIGTNAGGLAALGNVADGIYVELSVNNHITGNTIALNGRNGVTIAGDAQTAGNKIRGNRIFANAVLGIDLGADGPTPNDINDTDVGANQLQNTPVIEQVLFRRGELVIRYRVSVTQPVSSDPLTVEFFRGDAFNQVAQGAFPLFSDAYGPANAGQTKTTSFRPAAGTFALGDFVTATATRGSGDTSEFAPALESVPGEIVVTPITAILSSSSLWTSELGSTAVFEVSLSAKPIGDVTISLASSNTAEGTVSASQLVFTPGNFNRPQRVTITGVDDAITDGDVAYQIEFDPASSPDPEYDGVKATSVDVVNLDEETGDSRIFIRPPEVVKPEERFTYEVLVVNLGAEARFTVSFDVQSTPANLITVDQIVSPRRGRRGRHGRAGPLQVDLGSGAAKTITIHGRALEGSGGAALHAEASAEAAGRTPVTAMSDDMVAIQALTLTLTAPSTVFAPTGFPNTRFDYEIKIHNPNAVAATGVQVNIFTTATLTAGRLLRASGYSAVNPGGPFLLGQVESGENLTIILTAFANRGDYLSFFATLTGSVGGVTVGSQTPAKYTGVSKSSGVEWLFLAGLAALAGQEYLDQRRKRRRRASAIEPYVVDEVFEELANAD